MNRFTVALLLIFISNYSFGCSCIGENSIKNEIKNRDVVLIGKIISQEEYEEKDTLYHNFIFKKIKFKIAVIEKLKGEIKTDTISIFTGLGRGDCGINFKIGEKYIIYANYDNEHFNIGKKVDKFLTTNICTRTKLFEKKEFKKIKRFTKRKSY